MVRRCACLCVCAAVVLFGRRLQAQQEPVEVEVRGSPREQVPWAPGRASSRVQQKDLQEQLPRSAPDALRFEPGVTVQQTADGQGSAFIRGRTGQQILLLFDGIRINNSTFRQGPNQYFFTVDPQTLHSIDVVRGGGSTRFGSDAVAGVIDAHPLEPRLELGRDRLLVHPRLFLRGGTADSSYGFRSQFDVQFPGDVRVLAGFGERHVGRLRSGGVVTGPDGEPALVPAFEDDDRTQLGTGFREMTGDARVVVGLGQGRRVVGAAYLYRQYDAPRTDKCPPPYAPRSECLTYDEQFRTLAYLQYQGKLEPLAQRSRIALSFQRQHELRQHRRPAAEVVNRGRDDVNTVGAVASLQSRLLGLGRGVGLEASYGADVYYDWIESQSWTIFRDLDVVIADSRGQYLNGSGYTQGGAFVDVDTSLGQRWSLHTGARLAGAHAQAPGDPQSGTAAVDRGWSTWVGHGGLEWQGTSWLTLLANVDRSFRAPNLDDLTSRQQTGPGFQFENPDLDPETAITLETGARVHGRTFEAEVWAYRQIVDNAIVRTFRSETECPPSTPQCAASWSRYQLVNLPEAGHVDGVEGVAHAYVLPRLRLGATVAYARGEGPDPQQPTETVPLSRIPPVNGTAELRWNTRWGLYMGPALRWAGPQKRLAPTDRTDPRIPPAGTPGYAVLDLRAGYRYRRELIVGMVIENVTDEAYRVHGSSINGPGRGLIVQLEAGL